MKVIFFTEGKNNPSTRFRAQQFFPYLRKLGFDVKEVTSHPPKYYVPNVKNQYLFTLLFGAFVIVKSLVRICQIPCALFADVVFVQRELVPFGLVILEKWIKLFNRNIIFDFDDSIFIYDNQFSQYLKKRNAPGKIMSISKAVIAGNGYLANYAKKYNSNTVIIPTVIDVDSYPIKKYKNISRKEIIIGWMGTHSNLKYLRDIIPALKKVHDKYPNAKLKIVSDRLMYTEEFKRVIPVQFKKWTKEDEVCDLQSFDIGLMPLSKDKWSVGKCGFKLIQYMTVGVPSVASKIGANAEIVEEGNNGFLAIDNRDWANKITKIIEDESVQRKFYLNGRRRIEETYSIESAMPKLVQIFKKTTSKKAQGDYK